MAINAQNQLSVNKVFIRGVNTTTEIVSGALQTRAVLQLGGANVTDAGVWTDLNVNAIVVLDDIDSLPTDLAALATNVTAVETTIISLADGINAVRKLI
jgi:hypothetical protein